MGIVGLMKTAAPVTIPFKEEGRTVMLVGGLGSCDATRFGGTQYAKNVLESRCGDYRRRSIWITRSGCRRRSREIVNGGLAESAHDLSDGGLAVALAECSLEGMGAAIEISTDLRPEFALFHEGPSRVLVSTAVPTRDRTDRAAARRRSAAHRRYNERAVTDRQRLDDMDRLPGRAASQGVGKRARRSSRLSPGLRNVFKHV